MEKSAGNKPDPYLLRRLLMYGFLLIFILTPLIGLSLSYNIAHGYESDLAEIALLNYTFPYDQSVKIIHELIDGQTIYIAYEGGLSETEMTYGLAAVDLSDPIAPGIIWSLSLSDDIEDLALDGSFLYISTSEGGFWVIDLEASDGPWLQDLDTFQEKQTKTRYRELNGSSQYNTTLSVYNLPQYPPISYLNNLNSLLGAYSWSGFGFPQNYRLPTWSQTNLWNQPLSQYSLYIPQQWTMPISTYDFLNQYTITGLPYSYGSGMFTYNWIPGITGAWPQTSPWYVTKQPTTSSSSSSSSSSTKVRYRSPVPVTLSLNNTSDTAITGEITLRLKNLDGKGVSEQSETLTLDPGLEDYPLILNKVPEGTDPEDYAKYNLMYSFAGTGASYSGQKSLFQVADKMEVRIIGPDSMYAGEPTNLGIHAFVHGRPVSLEGASVTVDLIKGNTTERLYSDITDENGFAEVRADIPEATGSWKIRAKVSSDLGSETITEDIEIVRLYKILLTTDKPIYQPGQTIHIRTLTLKKPELLPQADHEIIIEVEDPKGNKVFRVDPRTDEFGVASADFTLGADINMGLYTVRAIQMEEGVPTQSEKKVTVERYVLPKFKVDLETDAEYYSPGDNIHGVVHAKYFFGKDLDDATVTIEASKFDVEFVPFQTIAGQTDADGFFSFDLTLPTHFVGLPLEQGNAFVKLDIKVEDTAEHEEAIVRELTVTKDPILIKLTPESGSIVPGIENVIYLITTDPKGRGIATTNRIDFAEETLYTDTDAQGIGSFTVMPDEGSTLLFQITSQSNGQSAYIEIDLSDELDQARILLRTDQAIYKVGETMTIDVSTPEFMARRVFVDIIRDRQTILTEGVDIDSGHGQLILDLSNDMAGTLLVEAYYISLATETASDVYRDKKIVYVNPAEDVQVTVALDKDQYLPGEKAMIQFQVTPAQTAALGVTIVDEAVYALQENQPGLLKVYFSMEEEIMVPRFWPLPVPYEEAVTSEYPDEEVQEMAQIAFASAEEPDDPGLDESSYPGLVQRMKEALLSRINKDADQVAKDLGNQNIYSESAYNNALSQGLIKTYNDPWGNAYKLEVGYSQVILESNGPDEKSGTMDDIFVTKPYQRVYTPYTAPQGGGGSRVLGLPPGSFRPVVGGGSGLYGFGGGAMGMTALSSGVSYGG
ncbi:MAG: MG2 domain-containing protein, partial [bacterium]